MAIIRDDRDDKKTILAIIFGAIAIAVGVASSKVVKHEYVNVEFGKWDLIWFRKLICLEITSQNSLSREHNQDFHFYRDNNSSSNFFGFRSSDELGYSFDGIGTFPAHIG